MEQVDSPPFKRFRLIKKLKSGSTKHEPQREQVGMKSDKFLKSRNWGLYFLNSRNNKTIKEKRIGGQKRGATSKILLS